MTANHADAPAASAIASATDASASPPTVVASTVPLANAEQLSQGLGDHSVTSTAHTAEAPAHEEAGMPQLDLAMWPGQIVWMLTIFGVFFVLMARVFTPRLRKVIGQRGSTIAEELANARANRDEAEAQAKEAATETAAAHAAARKMAAEALARSNAETAAAQAAEDVKLNARLGEAEARIRASRDEAMGHVRDIAADTAQAIVEKLTGKAATAASLKSAFNKVS